jgi:outer membrane immunogenic protein|tara:strand:- start:81 stop:770 length:690 start_codon:yes stop_codon:yes gene_type:complete
MRKFLFVLFFGIVSTTSFAETEKFEGFTVEFSGGYQNTDSSGGNSPIVNGALYPDIILSGFDDKDSIYEVGGSYNFAISEKFLLGVGFDYSINDIKTGRSTIYGGAYADWNEHELKDVQSIYIKPQLVINENTLIYGKLGYVNADLSITKGGEEYVSSSDKSMNGYILGAGYKMILNQSVFGFVEVNYTKFDKEYTTMNGIDIGGNDFTQRDPVDMTSYAIKFGLGYQF